MFLSTFSQDVPSIPICCTVIFNDGLFQVSLYLPLPWCLSPLFYDAPFISIGSSYFNMFILPHLIICILLWLSFSIPLMLSPPCLLSDLLLHSSMTALSNTPTSVYISSLTLIPVVFHGRPISIILILILFFHYLYSSIVVISILLYCICILLYCICILLYCICILLYCICILLYCICILL